MTNTPESTSSPLTYEEQKAVADVEDAVLTAVTDAIDKVMARHSILALQAHELREAVRRGVEAGVDAYTRKRAGEE